MKLLFFLRCSSRGSFVLLPDLNIFLCFFFSDERMFSSRWMYYSNNTIKVEAFCFSCDIFFLLQIWILFYVIFLWWMNAFCQMDERVEEHNKGRSFCSSRGSFLLLLDLNNFLCFFSLMNACFLGDGWTVQERNKGISFYSSHESFLLLLDINTFLCFFFLWWMISFGQIDEMFEEHDKGTSFSSSRDFFFFFSQIWIFCESFLLLPPICNVVCLLSSFYQCSFDA